MRHHGFPAGHPRFRHKAVAPYCSIPALTPPLELGDTLYLQMGYRARINVAGIGGGVLQDIEDVTASSSDPGIFVVEDPTEAAAIPAPPADVVVIRAVSPGTATLTIRADAEPATPDVPLTDTVTIIVYRVATQLVLYYTESGSTDELLAPLNVLGNPEFFVPFNTTFTLRVEGQDREDNVVELSNIVWFENSVSFRFDDTVPPDPYRKVLVPEDNATERAFTITADGDPSPAATTLTMEGRVNISTDDLLATILTETYSIEPV